MIGLFLGLRLWLFSASVFLCLLLFLVLFILFLFLLLPLGIAVLSAVARDLAICAVGLSRDQCAAVPALVLLDWDAWNAEEVADWLEHMPYSSRMRCSTSADV